MMNKYFKYIIVFILLLLFIILSYFVCSYDTLNIDTTIYNYISSFINDDMTNIFKVITLFGDFIGIIIVTIISFIYFRDKKINISIICNLFLVFGANTILKLFFRRDRPSINRLTDEVFYSYPSAHAMVSTAFYGYLIYLINKRVKNKSIKIFFSIILSILIILISLSRVYLGVHYTTDVIGGILVAFIYLIFFIKSRNIIDLFNK